MRYLGDYKEGETLDFIWSTNDGNGAASDPSTVGTVRVYKADGTTEVSAPTGITDTRTFDGVTGIHQCQIDLSASGFYVKEQDYTIVLVGAVIDSQTVNAAIATFSIENRYQGWKFIKDG